MRMMGRPIEHGAGDAEIVMLPRQTLIDGPALAHLRLKRLQLRPSAPRLRSIRKADSARLQTAVQSLQQVRPANGVNGETAAANRPPLERHAVTAGTDMHANHPRPKGLEQLLAITRVIAQIGDDQRIAVVARVTWAKALARALP
jgi:hypothetical protein